MAHTSKEQQIAAAWNAQADVFNQWDELDLEEKIEWAAKWGAYQAQRVPLSDAQIDEYVKHADMHGRYAEPFARGVRWGIRHYERVHGITQEKQP